MIGSITQVYKGRRQGYYDPQQEPFPMVSGFFEGFPDIDLLIPLIAVINIKGFVFIIVLYILVILIGPKALF